MLKQEPLLRVGVLCSSRAPGLAELLARPERGRCWRIACVVTSEATIDDRDALRSAGVPFISHPISGFLADRNATLRDRAARRDYDIETARILRGMAVDAVVLLGYLYILSPAFLRQFPSRVVNVHDSDLTVVDGRGEPRFKGLHSTRDAIVAGAHETRSSVHLVTEHLDAGPVLGLSEAYPVSSFALEAARAGHHDIVRAYAYAQREWMMRTSWAALIAKAIERFATSDPLIPSIALIAAAQTGDEVVVTQ